MIKYKAKLFSIFFYCIVSTAQSADYLPAELLEGSMPVHPYRVYQTRDADSGMVELVFMVDKSGIPVNIEIVRSPMPIFEHQASLAISKYKYQPATLNSKPIKSRRSARVEFDHSRIDSLYGFTNPMDAPEG